MDSKAISLLSYTLRFVSLSVLGRLSVWVVITDTPVYMRERRGGGRGEGGLRIAQAVVRSHHCSSLDRVALGIRQLHTNRGTFQLGWNV